MKLLDQKECKRLLDGWPIPIIPEYREFTCASCGQTIQKAWHIHCLIGGYKREFHLCDRCGLKYGLKPDRTS